MKLIWLTVNYQLLLTIMVRKKKKCIVSKINFNDEYYFFGN